MKEDMGPLYSSSTSTQQAADAMPSSCEQALMNQIAAEDEAAEAAEAWAEIEAEYDAKWERHGRAQRAAGYVQGYIEGLIEGYLEGLVEGRIERRVEADVQARTILENTVLPHLPEGVRAEVEAIEDLDELIAVLKARLPR